MSDRDRLSDLLMRFSGDMPPCFEDEECDCRGLVCRECYAQLSDYLLSNGVIVPPCKVGQTVWLIKSSNWQHTEWEIKEGKISMIQQKADKSWKFRVTENRSVQDYTVDKIGKTAFLTREEAETALKERKEK